MGTAESARKLRGAFFTPAEMVNFLVAWAIRAPGDCVLEPSCGEAGFMLAAANRLRALGCAESLRQQLDGVEIHRESAEAADRALQQSGFSADIQLGDFFDLVALPEYDAVIGNPPYVRYQQFSGADRAKALRAALAHGVRLTQLASSWAAFTVHAAQFLKPDGRLGLVLPAELLTVSYAAEVRRFLLRRFRSVRLIMFEALVFPGVMEEVVLLLAEGSGGARKFEVHQAKDLGDLHRLDGRSWSGFNPEGDEKWTAALLPSSAFEAYRHLANGLGFETLLDWGETSLGAVTGNNSFFTLTRARVEELGLKDAELLRISPPGARHLRGLSFTERAWERLARAGEQCYLFAPPIDLHSRAARQYIELGENAGVHKAYKCRTRKPWWRVPVVPKPDLLFTYMNYDRPRLSANEARVYHLNSLYGVFLEAERCKVGRELLPLASLNSVTLLGAEMVGRAYGGGLLKHEPREADLLPVPSFETLRWIGRDLRLRATQVAALLRTGDVAAAVELVDGIILEKCLGSNPQSIAALREARAILFRRRQARSRGDAGAIGVMPPVPVSSQGQDGAAGS